MSSMNWETRELIWHMESDVLREAQTIEHLQRRANARTTLSRFKALTKPEWEGVLMKSQMNRVQWGKLRQHFIETALEDAAYAAQQEQIKREEFDI